MQSISLSQFNYELPEERIALHPLKERDQARMLVYRKGQISHSGFSRLADELPENSLLVFNETKVVQARILMRRATGAAVEVFCLHPLEPYSEMSRAMQVKAGAVWQCMAGNQKRWKEGERVEAEFDGGRLSAELIRKEGREVKVHFRWAPEELSWAQVLEKVGKIPLPPYIKREPGSEDKEDYQTVYARQEGAVAAPTAGLHFTDRLIEELEQKGVEMARLTLHVSAGTFQPVEEENVLQHPMHNEQLVFEKAMIEELARSAGKKMIPAGTTSLRALESLYWFGQQLASGQQPRSFFIQKLYPYSPEAEKAADRATALLAVLEWMKERNMEVLTGQTEIFIFPGYKFRLTDGLITNFHLPQSTLLMLIAALTGDDWKKIYDSALKEKYRFLSYGDGSLLLP